MSLLVYKLTTSAVAIDDLGITITGAVGATYDLVDLNPNNVTLSAVGGDLEAAILGTTPFSTAELVVVDPRSGYTGNLDATNSLIALRAHNDAHIGVQLANLGDMDDVNLTGATTSDVLQLNGSGTYVPVTPATLAGSIALGDLSDVDDLAAHTLDAPVVMMGDGTNYDTVPLIAGTDLTSVAVTGTSLTINVDDNFLRNTGDNLESGTLTVDSGATIAIATGGSLTIVDAPTSATDATNKEYVDSVAAGLDPKESVRYGSVLDVSGTYSSSGGTGGTGAFTNVDFTSTSIFDGLTAGAIAIGDRILVKSQTELPGFADAAVAGAPAGSVVPALTAATYDFDVTVDGGTLQTLSIAVTASDDYDAIAALMSTQVTGGSVAFVGGSFQVTSATTGQSSTVVVAAGTAGSGGGDLFAAITAQAAGNPAVTFPTPSAGTASTENGIYVVTTAGATGAMERAPDQDGSPASEVSGGNYTFVENGTTLSSTGWVLQGDGILTLNTDPISWVQFSESSDFSAGDGLALTGSVFSLDINNMTPATIALGDEIAFNDITGPDTPQNTTVQDMLNDLNIPYGLTGTGIVVQTADDTYTKVSIAVDGAGALDGLAVANADGTAGNPTIGLDINGLPSGVGVEPIASTDRLAVYNVTTGNNVYYTVNDIANAGAANGFGIVNGDTGTATADAPTDPIAITTSVNGGITTTGVAGASAALTIGINVAGLAAGSTMVLADEIAVNDSGTTVKYTFTDMVQDLQIPNAVGVTAGFLVSDGSGNYTTRTISASALEDEDGLIVNTTDGSANLTVGLDIVGMTDPAEDMAATDEFAVHNKSEGTGGANRKMTGQDIADGVLSITNLTGMTFSTINGQTILTYVDATRGETLSTDSTAVAFGENRVGNNDWMEIGGAVDALSGYIMPMDATIVGASIHSASVPNGNTKTFDLYVDAAIPTGGTALLSLTGTAGDVEKSTSVNTTDINVNQNQKIRIRGDAAGGTIQDTVITLWVRWRA